jgi:hypothetical protein
MPKHHSMSESPQKEPIYVSRKILADVGRGIYRSPANALKELVSNAFDACATSVKITTNSPYFDVFTCEDDGGGISLEEFKEHFKRIGSSTKRRGGLERQKCAEIGIARPIIGKIGIGLLAVSQICNRFTVVSKERGKDFYFRATVDLAQFDKDESYLSGENAIKLGEYDLQCPIEVPAEDTGRSYTIIVMESLKDGFRRTLQAQFEKQIVKLTEYASENRTFADFLRQVSGRPDVRTLSPYDCMLWELGVLCPVEYLKSGDVVFPNQSISADIRRLKDYRFSVSVDGVKMAKSICIFRDPELAYDRGDCKVYTLPAFDEDVEGETLKFHGYLYSQRRKITPTELQGVLIRIRDVGVGGYDRHLLRYPREEGPIFGMISGEVFVEQGLENALNIDRNSFNETHPHFQRLRSEIHKFVKDEVVQDIRARSQRRRQTEQAEDLIQQLGTTSGRLKGRWGIHLSAELLDTSNEEPFRFDPTEGKLVFHLGHKSWAKAQKARSHQMQAVMAFSAAQLAIQTGMPQSRVHELFRDALFGKG